MNAILNITYGGLSHDSPSPIPSDMSDDDVRRISAEILREHHPELDPSALNHFVVDRFDTPTGGKRVYLRPKVPFGA